MDLNSKKMSREERERKLIFKHKFENRITIARYGKESLDAGDYGNALHRFVEYLGIIAEYKEVKDLYSLRVSHFDPKKELTEMMMISHIFLQLARIYDASPKFQDECKRCLDQFVAFSSNQPYQVVNSELIRKSIKKSMYKQTGIFLEAHKKIYTQSKKCYVVTFCYGPEHQITKDYRDLKDWMLNYRWGQNFIRFYYTYSSRIVPRWEKSLAMHFFSKLLIRPVLVLFSKTILRLILNKC